MINLRLMVKQDLPFLLEVRNHETTRINLENNSTFSLNDCEIWFKTLKSPWYIIENKNTANYTNKQIELLVSKIVPISKPYKIQFI